MALTPYTSNDEVRSLLGVTTSELKDAVLNLPVYETGLRRELIRIGASLPSAFSTVAAIASGSRTTQQEDLYETTTLFAAYAAARQAGAALGQFSPKELTDDKASFARFSSDPYKDVLDRVDAGYALARGDLEKAFSDYASTPFTERTVPAKFLIASQRVTDPVTGV